MKVDVNIIQWTITAHKGNFIFSYEVDKNQKIVIQISRQCSIVREYYHPKTPESVDFAELLFNFEPSPWMVTEQIWNILMNVLQIYLNQ